MLTHALILAGLLAAGPPAMPIDTLQVGPLAPIPASSVRLPAHATQAPPPPIPLGEAYTGWKIRRVAIHGVPGDVEKDLARGLALTGHAKWLVLRRRPPFSSEMLGNDLERARLYLARNGYPAAAIRPRFETDVKKRTLTVHFDVEPGPRLQVAANRIEAIPPSLQPRARKLLALDRNEPFRDESVERHSSQLLNLLQEHGRARAEVTTRIEAIDSTHVVVYFHVDAGPVYRFADVRIEGAPPNLRTTVLRTMDIDRGERFRPTVLHRAENGLRALDLFRRVEVRTEDAPGDSLDVLAVLVERAPRTLEVGVGYYTDEQFQIASEWKHRNLFGGGRGFSIDGSFSRYLQQAGVTTWKPVLFHSRTLGSVRLDVRRESEELYELRSAEIEAAATYLQSTRTTYRPAITVSRIDVETALPIDSLFESPPRSLITAALRWTHAALDNELDPRRGTYAWAETEYGMPDFEFANRYERIEAEGSAFHPLTDRTVISGRLHAGAAFPVSTSLGLLPNKRFYSGGAGSMRGYRRRKLGPLDTQLRPIGGSALLESSLELRFPLFGELMGAGFVDAGQTWERRDQYLRDLAVAAGPGLLLRTPIGLARFYVAFLLTDSATGQPSTLFQIQVGHGF